jgi:2-oxoisovalerate dehydrogenase E1 component
LVWLTLTVDDFIFGSHRSHGEILAKGLSAISKLKRCELSEVMDKFFDGSTVSVVKKGFNGSVKELGRRFLIYGTLAEIFARETGFQQRLGR